MRTVSLGAAVAALVFTASADAAIVVQTDRGQVVQNSIDPMDGKWIVRLRSTSASAPTTFWIDGDGDDDIKLIEVDASNPGQTTQLRIGGGGLGNIRDIDRIERKDGTSKDVWIKIMRIRRNLGPTEITLIEDAVVGGDVTGDIQMLPREFGGRTDILSLVVRGDLLGDIDAPRGGIQALVVDGSIGQPGAPVSIDVSGDIRDLRAGEIHAHVDTATYMNPGFDGGYLGRIETTGLSGAGAFTGSVRTKTFTGAAQDPGLFLAGPLEADVRLESTYSWGFAEIVLPPGGLRSQVIINGWQVQGGWWSDPIKVGPDGDPDQLVLASPPYPETPSMIGGGSVGYAPFQLHASACDPPHMGVTAPQSGAPTGLRTSPVVVRHYGPVTWSPGEAPLTIERRMVGFADPWVDVTSDFTFEQMSPLEIGVVPAPGGVGFEEGYEHRVRPMRSGPGALRCADVLGSPLVVVNDSSHVGYEYLFTVEANCPTDLDGDGDVDAGDLALLLGAWGPCGVGCPGDLNADGDVDASDLALLLGGWGDC